MNNTTFQYKTFTLELSVTEKCNLGCPYCYVANRNTFMTPEIFDEKLPMLIKLMKSAGTDTINISFFGGEPMLNWELIEYVTKKMKTEYQDILGHLIIISNMTMIDQEKIDFMEEWGIRASWSFDGITSNETRPLLPMLENQDKDGKMYNGILELYKDKIHLIKQVSGGCKVMIWPGNQNQMLENYEFFLDYEIYNPDFSIVRDDVWTKEDIVKFRENLIILADRYIEEVKKGTYTTIGFFTLHMLDAIFGYIYGKRPFSCFAGTHGGILMPNGDFYPCARFASKKLMKMDENHDFQYWQNELNPQNFDKCQSCDMYQVCNTGCSYSQIQNGNKPLDSVCELFHIIEEQTHRIVHELKDSETFRNIVINTMKNVG